MTVTVLNLVPSKFAENSQTTQYTSTGCKTIIDKCTITNTSAASVPFSANLVPSGGSASSSNLHIPAKSIAVGECYPCPELVGHTLNVGGSVSTLAGTASVLVLNISGRQIT